ncbi:Unknown protein sequence [Pseudomonas syringae pv. syringae]|nr:Unknown protein sequence [Pseudomonas syringae pv. syringae]
MLPDMSIFLDESCLDMCIVWCPACISDIPWSAWETEATAVPAKAAIIWP